MGLAEGSVDVTIGLMVVVKEAQLSVRNAWLELATEVADLFEADMANDPSFHQYIERVVASHQAFAAYADADVAGIVTISRRRNCIAWLAVFERFRNRGIGTELLRHAIRHLDTGRDIEVVTFRPGTLQGEPARNLYLRCGFRDKDPAFEHDGRPRCLMALSPNSDDTGIDLICPNQD